MHIGLARLPNGQQIRLLKSLLTSACERNCNYCPFRAGRDFRRATFKPEEFAATFDALTSDPTWQSGAHHRAAGLEDTYAIMTLPRINGFNGVVATD